ncbi:MAG: hypothetical protein VXZ67_03290 [Pseudomonadota bacterium]|nr:hypothetical protein [Pseudomonadota bacterium]
MTNAAGSDNRTKPGLSMPADWLLTREDWPALRLETTPDDHARLCRAWLLRGVAAHPDHAAAEPLLTRALAEGATTPDGTKAPEVLAFLTRSMASYRRAGDEWRQPWEIFCPPAAAASTAPDEMADAIRARRQLHAITPADAPLRAPAEELLFTTNALICPPLDPDSPEVPPDHRAAGRRFADSQQAFWYDHPIPLDARPEENEILYGLASLDRALAVECADGTLPPGSRIDLVMSVSVTHPGMEATAFAYVRDIIGQHLDLRHLRIFLFDEERCRAMVRSLCPGDSAAGDAFGVNGAYGRHYSFLKAILLVWQIAVNPKSRFTFKIDLDQVFDQTALKAHAGRTALQAIANPLWGGTARDHAGRQVDLGMLAGGLVNEGDAADGLFIPDVRRPDTDAVTAPLTSRRLFCPQWPQAISTEAEILQRESGFQRVHVTGGTTGITADALRRWRPFTPSFINRAEDQAYALSALCEGGYLGHLHADGLIMRHDKQAFAARAIAHASAGKAIGDIERLLLFSRYAALNPLGSRSVHDHLWPFTACFVTPDPAPLAGLIFAIDGAARGGSYVRDGAKRLGDCLSFCEMDMKDRLAREQAGWDAVYAALAGDHAAPAGLADIVSGARVYPAA